MESRVMSWSGSKPFLPGMSQSKYESEVRQHQLLIAQAESACHLQSHIISGIEVVSKQDKADKRKCERHMRVTFKSMRYQPSLVCHCGYKYLHKGFTSSQDSFMQPEQRNLKEANCNSRKSNPSTGSEQMMVMHPLQCKGQCQGLFMLNQWYTGNARCHHMVPCQ